MFIAKNNDLIILAKDTEQELLKALKFMVYTSIEETDIEYEFIDGQYLTSEEAQVKKEEQRNQEIDQKISELQTMCIPDILHGNKENIELYNEVIAGLEAARP